MNKEEVLQELITRAKKIDIEMNKEEQDKFYRYMNLVIEWNEKINLTAITEPSEFILKHFIDSITINKYIKSTDRIIDIGTGAGFPGIPLKIMNDGQEFVLVDSLNKRIHFLNEVCRELKLTNISCLHSRAEELAGNQVHREQYDIVTSRAVARLCTLLEYMLPFVKIGGKCICMKGPNATEEIEEAQNAIAILGGKLKKVENIILPDSDIERNIIIIEKVNSTPKQYPRKAGVPSKQPILS